MEHRVIAWMGGSRPPTPPPEDVAILSNRLFDEQVNTWREFWGDEPDEDTLGIFRDRALYDAWASLRHNRSERRP